MAAGLQTPKKRHSLKLVPTPKGGDVYSLTFGGKPWPG
jgi:hypothetical protein